MSPVRQGLFQLGDRSHDDQIQSGESFPDVATMQTAPTVAAYRQSDFKTAMREFKAFDDATVYYMLGVMFEKGNGTKSDYAVAAEWYRKSSEKGSSAAQYRLVRLYERGLGVEENFDEAVKLYRISARQGYADAKLVLKRLEKN